MLGYVYLLPGDVGGLRKVTSKGRFPGLWLVGRDSQRGVLRFLMVIVQLLAAREPLVEIVARERAEGRKSQGAALLYVTRKSFSLPERWEVEQ